MHHLEVSSTCQILVTIIVCQGSERTVIVFLNSEKASFTDWLMTWTFHLNYRLREVGLVSGVLSTFLASDNPSMLEYSLSIQSVFSAHTFPFCSAWILLMPGLFLFLA